MASRQEKLDLLDKKATHGKYVSIGYLGYLKEGGKPVSRDIKVGLTLKDPDYTGKTPEQIKEDKAKRKARREQVNAKGGIYAMDVHTNEIKTFFLDQIFWIISPEEEDGHDYRINKDFTKLPKTIDEIDNTPGGETLMNDEYVEKAKALLFDPEKNEPGSPIQLGYNPAIPKKPKAPKVPGSPASPGSKLDPSYIDTSNVSIPTIDINAPRPSKRKPIASLKISRRDI